MKNTWIWIIGRLHITKNKILMNLKTIQNVIQRKNRIQRLESGLVSSEATSRGLIYINWSSQREGKEGVRNIIDKNNDLKFSKMLSEPQAPEI